MTENADPFFWAKQGPPAHLMALLNGAGEARFVGGSVRDSLLGFPPGYAGATDIDIATTLRPDAVVKLLEEAGVRVIPTGVEHGTVTAVIDRVPMEITTLRSDVSTDGRRATVAFTDDWAKDVARRDFTINGLYLTASGEVIDLVGGRADLQARRVRFIDDPASRIAEDYLRILRFIRFSARFGEGFDAAGWAACVAARAGLSRLSKERIWSEIARFFPMPSAPMAVGAMVQDGVAAEILDSPTEPDLFSAVHALGRENISPALGIIALWPDADAAQIRAAFKPSNEVMAQIAATKAALKDAAGDMEIRESLYRHGRDATDHACRLRFGAAGENAIPNSIQDALSTDIPECPFAGRDLIALGVTPGPSMGETLARAEAAWVADGFPEAPDVIAAILQKVVATRA